MLLLLLLLLSSRLIVLLHAVWSDARRPLQMFVSVIILYVKVWWGGVFCLFGCACVLLVFCLFFFSCAFTFVTGISGGRAPSALSSPHEGF